MSVLCLTPEGSIAEFGMRLFLPHNIIFLYLILVSSIDYKFRDMPSKDSILLEGKIKILSSDRW